MELANRLRELRKKKGLTIREVANAIEVPVSTYREWEYGRAILGEPYSKLAEVFEVSLSELITGKKPTSHGVFDRLSTIQHELDNLTRELSSLF